MERIDVEVCGVKCVLEGEPSSVKNAVERVEKMVSEISRGSSRVDTLSTVIRVALILSDEVSSLKKEIEKRKVSRNLCIERLERLIESVNNYLKS